MGGSSNMKPSDKSRRRSTSNLPGQTKITKFLPKITQVKSQLSLYSQHSCSSLSLPAPPTLVQQSLSRYYKTPPSPSSCKPPQTPAKCPRQRCGPPLDLAPCQLFQPSSLTPNLLASTIPTLQQKITQFFQVKLHPTSTSLSSSKPVLAPSHCPINRSSHSHPLSSLRSIKSSYATSPAKPPRKSPISQLPCLVTISKIHGVTL